jgi:hypothetical protein
LFERTASDPEGVSHLADGLSLLLDLVHDPPSEREGRVAGNLFKTYSRRAESLADQLLANVEQLPDESLEHWFNVMDEFDNQDLPVSKDFQRKKVAFVHAMIERLSPAERKRLFEKR